MRGVKWQPIEPLDSIKRVIIIASGPSLMNYDLKKLKKIDAYKITINESGKWAPFADAWFTLDPWGLTTGQIPTYFQGKKFAAVPDDYGTASARCKDHRVAAPDDVQFLHRLQSHNNPYMSSNTAFILGLSEDTGCINTGNSAYGALNLAYHHRPEKILLLGVDGTSGYFYPSKKNNGSLSTLPSLFASTVDQLKANKIQVVNGSIKSRVNAFERMTIDGGLEWLMS